MKKIILSAAAFVLSAFFAAGAYAAEPEGSAAMSNYAAIVAEYDETGVLTKVNTVSVGSDLETARCLEHYQNTCSSRSRLYFWSREYGKIDCISMDVEGDMSDSSTLKEDIMLVDYYDATVATVGGDCSYEAVLYEYSDTEAKLEIYQSYPDGEETRSDTYIVPYSAVQECYKLIAENGLSEWNDKYPSEPLMGAVTVCKFRGSDGSYIRVSTDAMPEDGKSMMAQIGGVMSSYAREEYNK